MVRQDRARMARPPHLCRRIKGVVTVLRPRVQRARVARPARPLRGCVAACAAGHGRQALGQGRPAQLLHGRGRRIAIARQLTLDQRAGRLVRARLGRAGRRQRPQRALAGLRVGCAAVHQLVPLGPPPRSLLAPARRGSSYPLLRTLVEGAAVLLGGCS